MASKMPIIGPAGGLSSQICLPQLSPFSGAGLKWAESRALFHFDQYCQFEGVEGSIPGVLATIFLVFGLGCWAIMGKLLVWTALAEIAVAASAPRTRMKMAYKARAAAFFHA